MLQKSSDSNLQSGQCTSLRRDKQTGYIYLSLSQCNGLHTGSDYRRLDRRSNARVASPAGCVLVSGDWLSEKS